MIKIVEEHHEAVISIFNLTENKVRNNYILLNFDDHSDFNIPLIHIDNLRPTNIREVTNVVYSDLRISDFIIFLLYSKIISNFIWIGNTGEEHTYYYTLKENKSYHNYISIEPVATKTIVGSYLYIKANLKSDIKSFVKSKIIISIDLDFFSCSNNSGESLLIQISADEYADYNNNKYNKIRLSYGSRAKVSKKNNEYYLHISELHYYAENILTKPEIYQKIKNLIIFIKRHKITPELIVICKSVKSGYTDQTKYQYILSILLEELKKSGFN